MDQPGATLSSDLGNIKLKNVKLKTNDFPIDLTNAKIYKYVIKFDPTDTWTKEKKFLMERFLAKLNTDRKSESFIYDKNKFEIILPNAQPELGSKLLLAFYFRRGRGTKAVDSLGALSQQAKTPGDFFGDVLTSRISSDKVRPVDFHIGNDSVRTCTVYADEQLINLEMLNNKQRQEVLDALDKILRKEAHDTGLTMHGKRVFDMACEPAVSGRMAELRKGVVSDNCTSMVDKSVVRRITPCTGVFLKEMNLAELLAHLRALENSNVEEVNQLLKGIKIKKIHGKQEVVQILGLMVGNAEQETFYWNNHKTTTVSNYMQKVYPTSNNNTQPDDGCVLVGTPQHQEILPTRLCSILPGQYSSLSASRLFSNSHKNWQKSLTDHASKCVSGWDGVLTKLLKCVTSPTIADQFHLKIPGYGQFSALRPTLSDPHDRVVEGTVLEKNIAIHKEALVESPPVLVFVIGSAEIESLDSFIDRGITRHFNSHLTKTKYHKTQIDDVGRLVTDVCIQLQKENPAAKTSKPALVGLFCKPSGIEKPGSTSEHESHFDELRQAYAKFKLYCHKEGYHFAGTFIQPTTKAQDDRKTRPAIFNTMYRLRTKLASAGTPNRLTTGISAHNSPTFLMLGIHAAQLATPFFEPPRSGKGQVSRWYLLSVVAKWCGGDGFPQSQTMLLKSPISGNGSKNDRIASFPSDLAMEKLKDCELLKGIALQNSTIIVFRAGLPPGLSNPEAKEAIRGVGKEVKTVKQHHKQTASNGGPREGENGVTANSASPANNAIKDKAFGDEAADEAAANRNGAPGHFELREEGLAKGESSFNSEVRELEEFANRRNARLVYCTVNAKTNARLFSQTGQPLVQDESCLPDQKAITAEARRVSSIFVYPPKPAPGTSTIDWLIQKQFTEKAETNTPLLLKYHPIDQTIIDSDSVRNAIFEACWDFPAGTWSSKNLSCVALAKKANRHAMRIIQPDRNGQPSIPGLHADLKNSLYFI